MTEPRVGVAIMAHRKRESFVPGILERLDAAAEVVYDERNDRWDTGRRAMLAHDPDATAHLVIQDDALICRDLVAGMRKAVAYSGDHPVALYTGRVRPNQPLTRRNLQEAARREVSWFVGVGPLWGVAVCVPVVHIPKMVAWGDTHPATKNYDIRMTQYFTSQRIACWYTIPSLVEHRQGPSLVPGRTGANRVAWNFIGEHASALDVDWSRLPRLDQGLGYRRVHSRRWVCDDCSHITATEPLMQQHRRRLHAVLTDGVKSGILARTHRDV